MPLRYFLPNGRVATYHDNSCHGEDAFVSVEINQYVALDAVLDGATASGGQYASRYAAEALRQGALDSPHRLLELLERINQTLFRRGKGRFFLTTLSAALKVDDTLHVVSVGDSPMFLIRQGNILPLTSAAKRATSGALTALLGRHEKLACELIQVALQEDDRLLLATDGVSDNVSLAELGHLINKAMGPEAAVQTLRELLSDRQRGHRRTMDTLKVWFTDDATAIIRFLDKTIKAVESSAAAG